MSTSPDPQSPYTRTTTGSRNSARRRVVLATAGVAVGAVTGTAFVTAALAPAATTVASHTATTVTTGDDDDSSSVTGTSTSITAPSQATPQTAPVTTSGGS